MTELREELQEKLTKEADALRAQVTEALVAKGVWVTRSELGFGSMFLNRGRENCSVEIYGMVSSYSTFKSGVTVLYDAVSGHAPRWRMGLRKKRITRDTAAEHNVEKIVADLIAVLDLKDQQAKQRHAAEEAEKWHAKEASRLEALANEELPDPKKIFFSRTRLADGRYKISFRWEVSLATAQAIQKLLT